MNEIAVNFSCGTNSSVYKGKKKIFFFISCFVNLFLFKAKTEMLLRVKFSNLGKRNGEI